MANTSSAKKAIRVSNRKNAVNTRAKNEYKNSKRQILKELRANKTADAKKSFLKYQSAIDNAIKKGVMHKNTGARYKSRVAQIIKKLDTGVITATQV